MDRIDVGEIDAQTNVAGNNTFSFIGQNAFSSTQSGQIRFYNADGNTYIQFNTDLDSTPEMTIALRGDYSLTSLDFLL
jgi:serralysin